MTSARSAPGPVTGSKVRLQPVGLIDCRIFAPAMAAASLAFRSSRRMTNPRAPSKRSASMMMIATKANAKMIRTWPRSFAAARSGRSSLFSMSVVHQHYGGGGQGEVAEAQERRGGQADGGGHGDGHLCAAVIGGADLVHVVRAGGDVAVADRNVRRAADATQPAGDLSLDPLPVVDRRDERRGFEAACLGGVHGASPRRR